MKQKKKFEPFERVIYRYDDNGRWRAGLISDETEDVYFLIGGITIEKDKHQLLTYRGNEHLVGTSDMPDKDEVELKEGTICLFSDNKQELESGFGTMARFRNKDGKFGEDNVFVVYFANGNETIFRFCIPLAKFNSEDTDKNKNEILCVNNGRIVKAK